jgi:hypothetical protein
MARSRSDIANTAVRIFLQEMGKEYDRERGLEPFAKKHLKGEVPEFFECRCCFCDIELTAARVCGDHLIPMNKKDLGLDAWGNVVPACSQCNSKKHANDWRDFIIQRAGANAAERHQRMQKFLNAYPYAPAYELGSIVVDLYDESGAIALALIREKVVRTKETIQPTN